MDKQLEDYIKNYYLLKDGYYYHKISFGKPKRMSLNDVKENFMKRALIKN